MSASTLAVASAAEFVTAGFAVFIAATFAISATRDDVIFRPAATHAASADANPLSAAGHAVVIIIEFAGNNHRTIAIGPWGRGREQLLSSPRLFERLLLDVGKLGVGLRVFNFPIAFNQLEAEIKVAGLNCLPGTIVGVQPIRPDQQQRVRLGVASLCGTGI
jgi:hypothetical protein